MIRRIRAGGAAALVIGLLGSGCFRYTPVAPSAVPLGEDVRVFLSRRGMADLPEDLPTGGGWVAGRIIQQGRDSLLLQAPVRARPDDLAAPDLRQNVFVSNAEIVEVRRREFSGSRTVLAIAWAAGLGAAIVLHVIDAGGDATQGGEEPPDQLRVPLGPVPSP